EDQKPRRVRGHPQPLAGPQAREARRERAFRHYDAIELEHRVGRRAHHREGARHARAVDIERDAHELPGVERERRSLDAQTEQALGPMAVLDHLCFEPPGHWTGYGSRWRSCTSPPTITIAP